MTDDRERLADVWIRATRLVGLISIPSLVGLAIVAPDFVEIVLGPRWHRAVPVIQVLAAVGILQSLGTLSGEVLLALNRSGTLLRFTMVWFLATVGGVALGLQWGILGVATCVAVATALTEPVRAYLTTRALGISVWRFARSLVGIAQATALMAAILLIARGLLVQADAPTLLRLLLLIGLGTVAYVAGCLWRAAEIADEIRAGIGRRKAKRPPLESLEPGL
jgi:O-antigen/teichoic acid export membrane protein